MRVLRKFISIIRWLPVLWKYDCDWDFDSLVQIVKFKAERMSVHHKNGSVIAHWSHVSLQLETLRHLIELYNEDADDEWNAHYYGGWHNKEWKDINKLCGNPKECKTALALSSARTDRNWHNIWKYIAQHGRGWWD